MLKAVRFDTEKHKELLDWIASFKDDRGKKNESEAIRFLMQKGLESIQQPQKQSSEINIDKIKSEIFQQIISSIGPLTIQQQPIQNQVQDIPVKNSSSYKRNNETSKEVKQEPIERPKPESPKSKPKVDTNTNPLIANMLGNRNK